MPCRGAVRGAPAVREWCGPVNIAFAVDGMSQKRNGTTMSALRYAAGSATPPAHLLADVLEERARAAMGEMLRR